MRGRPAALTQHGSHRGGVLDSDTFPRMDGAFPNEGPTLICRKPTASGQRIRGAFGSLEGFCSREWPWWGPPDPCAPRGLEGGPGEHEVLWRGQAVVTGLPSAAAFNLSFHPEDPADYPKRAQPDLMRWVVPSLFPLSSPAMTEAENVASEVARIPTLPFSAGAPRISPNSKII